MSLEQALLSAVVALAACVGGLFAWFKAQFSLILGKLNECEDDREALWARIAEMASSSRGTEVLRLRPRPMPRQPRTGTPD